MQSLLIIAADGSSLKLRVLDLHLKNLSNSGMAFSRAKLASKSSLYMEKDLELNGIVTINLGAHEQEVKQF